MLRLLWQNKDGEGKIGSVYMSLLNRVSNQTQKWFSSGSGL